MMRRPHQGCRPAPGLCLPLLLLPAACRGAAPEVGGQQVPGRPLRTEHRVIVQYADAPGGDRPSLQLAVERLLGRPGVASAQALPALGMAVVDCDSEASGESLVEDLLSDASVEIAVPDTYIQAFGPTDGWGSWKDLLSGALGRLLSASAAPPSDLPRVACAANPACALKGLGGACCPGVDGVMLECCSARELDLVALRTYDGRYLAAADDGTVTAAATKIDNSSTFRIIPKQDGKFAFKTSYGDFLVADVRGRLVGTRTFSSNQDIFAVSRSDNDTVSLRTALGTYVGVEARGGLYADRVEVSSLEQFTILSQAGPSQTFANDTDFPLLWGMNDWGGYDIDAAEAWKTFTGSTGGGITVAVIDTGIDYNHEDLKENIWVNPFEIPGNGVDDDENGFVDDIHGADFVNDDGDPWDDQMHGTHVSGTIAGIGNNGLGVTGVAWRGVRLMGIKVLSATGSGRTSDAIRGIDYAVANGAKIASNSWGGECSNPALKRAIEQAEASGLLFVAASGNDGVDNDVQPSYPANYELSNIISVAASEPSGKLSSFSCYGNHTVHLAAPGSRIYSTLPGGAYGQLSGTSMATPHVTGLAALLWMYRPSLSMQQVRSVILGSVEKLASLEGKVSTGGLVNAKNALQAAWAFKPPAPPRSAPAALAFEDVDPRIGVYGGTLTITASADEADISFYRVYFLSRAGFQLEPLGPPVPATGQKQVTVQVNGSFVPPDYAKALVAVSGNATGEMSAESMDSVARLELEDYGVPQVAPRGATWGGDTDLRAGFVAGLLTVDRASSEASISDYEVYWRLPDGARGPLVGGVKAARFQEPTCSGNSCDLLDLSRASDGVVLLERGNYTSDESAVIKASGPATVTVLAFETEHYYDWVSIGTRRLSGDLRDVLPYRVDFPKGLFEIRWASDSSIQASGWTLELQQNDTQVQLRVPPTEVLGPGFEVVSAYGRTNAKSGLYAKVTDYTAGMRPSPALAPVAVAFVDVDPVEGVIAGVAEVTPALENAHGADGHVEFYQLDLVDSSGRLVAGGWKVAAGAGAAAKVKVAIPATVTTPLALGGTRLRLTARAGNSAGLGERAAAADVVDFALEAAAPPGLQSSDSDEVSDGDGGQEEDARASQADWKPPPPPEPWLRRAGPDLEASPADDMEVLLSWAPQAERRSGRTTSGRVRSTVVVPLPRPELATTASAKARLPRAFARALATALPDVDEAHVHVVRITLLPGAQASQQERCQQQVHQAARRSLGKHAKAMSVEFEVEPSPQMRAGGALARIEAQLILLSTGGRAAERLDAALAAELAAAGIHPARADSWRSHVAEPQHLGPRMLAARIPASMPESRLLRGWPGTR